MAILWELGPVPDDALGRRWARWDEGIPKAVLFDRGEQTAWRKT